MDVFLTRQPILDTHHRIVAYELLYRGKEAGTGDLSALLTPAPENLDPRSVIIQLQDAVPPDDDVVTVCRELAEEGFRFAMGDSGLHEK